MEYENMGTKRFGAKWNNPDMEPFCQKKDPLIFRIGNLYHQHKVRLILTLLIATLFIAALTPFAVVAQTPPSLNPGDVVGNKVAESVPGMVNTWDITVSLMAKDEIVRSDTVLVIDTSGSMLGTRLAKAKEAAIQFVNDLLPDGNTTNRVALVSFAGEPTTRVNFVSASGRQTLINAINALSATGGTHTQGAMHVARGLLDEVPAGQKADHNQIVLLSDGQPTYGYGVNYAWRMDTNNLDFGPVTNQQGGYLGDHWQTPSTVPEAQFLYTSARVGPGNWMYYRYDDPPGTANDKYYNLGNHAIAEADFAKAKDYTVYTIALEVNPVGAAVLQSMASPGKAYTATSGDLAEIFSQIAGEIAAAARNVSVLDPMGIGFTVLGNVSNMTYSQGTVDYNADTKQINWDVGTLITECPSPNTDPTLKCASLTYRIEIENSILDLEVPGDGLYYTNNNATFTYTDIDGLTQTKEFPKPKVNPVLYVLEKELKDYTGTVIKPDPLNRIFTFRVTSNYPNDPHFPRTYELTAGQKMVLTNLRYGATYTVEETGVSGYTGASLNDYTITHGITPGVTDEFVIIDDNTEDKYVTFTNQEKALGVLRISKEYYDINGNPVSPAVNFEFKITCPAPGLPENPCPDGYGIPTSVTVTSGTTETYSNLPYLRYKVTEVVPSAPPMTTVVNPPEGIVNLTAENRDQTVTYINNQNTLIGSGRFLKAWNGGPSNPFPDACFKAQFRDYVDPPGAWQDTPYLYKIDYSEPFNNPPQVVDGGLSYYTFFWPNVPLAHQSNPSDPSTRVYYEYQVLEGTCDESAQGLTNFVEYPSGAPENYTATQTNEQQKPWGTPNVYDVAIINTYHIPTDGAFDATKTWENGPTPKPTIYFQLYRKIAGGTEEAVLPPIALDGTAATAGEITACTNGTDPCGYENTPSSATVWNAHWMHLEETDINGNAYTYSFKEGNLVNGSFVAGVIPGYSQAYSQDGTGVTNSFIIEPMTSIDASKSWILEPPAPDYVLAYQLRRLNTVTTDDDELDTKTVTAADNWYYKWQNTEALPLPKTDLVGNPYEYYILEGHMDNGTFVEGTQGYHMFCMLPTPCYDDPQDASIRHCVFRNERLVSVTIEKKWAGGTEPRPEVYFRLYRQVGNNPPAPMEGYYATLDGTIDSPCPSAPSGCELEPWKATFSDLPIGSQDMEPYTYTLVEYASLDDTEPGTPAGYTLGDETCADYDTAYNRACTTYDIALADVVATKVWVNGAEADHTAVSVRLYRYSANLTTPEAVDDVTPTINPASGTADSFIYTFASLPTHDSKGALYTYYIEEGYWSTDNPPVWTESAPDNYTADAVVDLTITNTYKSPTDDITATKSWMPADLPDSLKTPVSIQLYRHTDNNDPVAYLPPVVLNGQPDAACTNQPCGYEDSAWNVKWLGLDLNDSAGNPYIYTVDEVPTPDNFEKSISDRTITNTYKSPTTGVVNAAKNWIPSDISSQPAIYLQLYRQIEGGTPAPVPGLNPVKLDGISDPVCAGTPCGYEIDAWKAEWINLATHDTSANPYTFSIKEGSYVGTTFTEGAPAGFFASDPECIKDNSGNTTCAITNTHHSALTVILDSRPNSNNIFNYLLTHPNSPGENFELDDNGRENIPGELNSTKAFNNLVPGTYRIKQTNLPAGWNLQDLHCEVEDMLDPGVTSPLSQTVDLINREVTINLEAAKAVTCTFVNTTSNQAQVIVDKITYPAGSPDAFNFLTSGEGYLPFTLTDASQPNDQILLPGVYSVTEAVKDGWHLLDTVCTSSVPNKVQTPASINLETGETVTCNFINVPPNTIAVKKVVTKASIAKFEFHGSLNGIIGHNEYLVKPNIVPTGELMSVIEKPLIGWKLSSINCVESGNVGPLATTTNLAEREALIGLDDGEVVLCTFINDPVDLPDTGAPTSKSDQDIPKTDIPIGQLGNLADQSAEIAQRSCNGWICNCRFSGDSTDQ